jgi:D-glycero-alpha-D-manno-heptose-7-phosphate kinase
MKYSVYATAPSRVDFAGGTLDIHPIYLFFDQGVYTINVAINLGAEVWLTGRDDERIRIRSLDTSARLECEGGVHNLPLDGPLALITRVLRYYDVPGGLDVTTKMLPPHGSGLGSSSTLFVTLAHAALAYLGKTDDPEHIIRTVNNLEAQLMGMPAGLQDYYPPTFGGLNAIHSGVDGVTVQSLDPDGRFFTELQQHLIVTYTNISHHSGSLNWVKMRNFFDRVPETVLALQRLKDTADEMFVAFKSQDMRRIAALIDQEWQNRRHLSDSVTTPEIERMMAVARDAGSWANKLCGAGGGGCMVTIAPPPAHAAVIAALEQAGATYLDAQLTQQGVQVTVQDVAIAQLSPNSGADIV